MDYNALKDLSYGMYILSTNDGEKPVGCVINSAIQITSASSIIAISVNKLNHTNEVIKKSNKFGLSILSTKTDPSLIGTFGFKSSKDFDKFSGIDVKYVNNLPIINENTTGYLICDVINIISVDTHDIFLAKIIDSKKINNLDPMTYSYYQKEIKGQSPKNAPTYIPTTNLNTNLDTNLDTYSCLICGYKYNEETERIPFKELPNNWICPICGAPKELFKKI